MVKNSGIDKIVSKKQLSDNVFQMEVEAALIANERKAGQFIILMIDEALGERIPLTIADADPARGTITLIFQTVGATTLKLSKLNVGDSLAAVLGPLGRPTSIRGANGEPAGHVVCVGGGIGVAPMHPIAQALKAAGNKVTIIMGARNKSLFVMEDEMRAIAGDDLILITDDNSGVEFVFTGVSNQDMYSLSSLVLASIQRHTLDIEDVALMMDEDLVSYWGENRHVTYAKDGSDITVDLWDDGIDADTIKNVNNWDDLKQSKITLCSLYANVLENFHMDNIKMIVQYTDAKEELRFLTIEDGEVTFDYFAQ